MLNPRKKAIETAINRTSIKPRTEGNRVADYYGANVFDNKAMQRHLSKGAYLAVKDAIRTGSKIDRKVAQEVATGMKDWAIKKGANSYTHWFQPLTGLTAEKHEMFFTLKNDEAIEEFSVDVLVQQEPDASSFPSGGIRQTFEARGYTAWDPASPAFIMEIGDGKTLCIPTIFISYTGETLDYKAPLLKSTEFLERTALSVAQIFDKEISRITVNLGWEQEYFLIDEALFYARPDLMATGRTLIGASASKGQQLEDHYFGVIKERIYAYMLDLESECHKLGIPLRTRHNEVAPFQFECAPMYEEINVAVDHNQLLMDMMERVARRHKLRVLLHEKPFAGINGSGKHNNWSMSTDKGKNLLSPGKTPKTNLLFLTFFANVLKAVSEYGDLIRASIASAGNDHRLGAHEAPPAIISAFIGSYMTNILDEIQERVAHGKYDEQANASLKLDIHKKIPDVLLDNTDRNRTSPFAFTGNKFEIRAVGSSANCALPMMVMNTIMAHQLLDFKAEIDRLTQEGESKEGAIMRRIRQYITDGRKICFEGDGYSEAWVKEAKKRGLNNVNKTPYALDFWMQKKYKEVFVKNGILSEREIDARYEVENHKYVVKIDIEANTLADIAISQIIPAALEYSNKLIANIQGLHTIGLKSIAIKAQKDLVAEVSLKINAIKSYTDNLYATLKAAHKMKSSSQEAKYYCDKIVPMMNDLRNEIDLLEALIDDTLWPLPKYREILSII